MHALCVWRLRASVRTKKRAHGGVSGDLEERGYQLPHYQRSQVKKGATHNGTRAHLVRCAKEQKRCTWVVCCNRGVLVSQPKCVCGARWEPTATGVCVVGGIRIQRFATSFLLWAAHVFLRGPSSSTGVPDATRSAESLCVDNCEWGKWPWGLWVSGA